jgi:anti-sigma B factor antagonist
MDTVKLASHAFSLITPRGRLGAMAAVDFKHISIKDTNGIAVVDFVNSQLMFATDVVDEIGAELNSLISDHSYSKIVLDFTNVQYVSSMMLAKLASLERHVEVAKGKLKFCGLGPILRDTFRIGHFDRVFDVYDNAGKALQSPW